MSDGDGFDATRLDRAWARIDADFDAHLDRIRAYLRQPSVSATGEGIEDCAEATAALVADAGGEVEIISTPGHPVVLGTIAAEGPRLLRYGMYDVQPAEEADWLTPPFGAEIRTVDGVGPAVVARGAANSKGTLAASLLAVASLRAVDELPASLVLLIEGEEELGSPHLPGVVDARRSRLEADAAFDLDLMADRSGTPEIFLGCKGILSLHLTCRGGDWGGPLEAALHSSLAVAVDNPAWSLLRALGVLVGRNEEVLVSAIGRAAMPPEDRPLVDALVRDVDLGQWARDCGVGRPKRGLDERALVERLLYEPAVSLNGIAAGYPEGGKTIIPHTAEAEVDFRLPYGTDMDAAAQAAIAAIAEVAPEVEVAVSDTCHAARTSAKSPVARAMIKSHEDEGHPARVWPSAPWWAPYYLFERTLRLPFAIGGAGHCYGAHAANEYASIEGLRSHMRHAVAFLLRYAEEHSVVG
jgi:acetylornithine deacetylase/succinyl-diaminopimelate desuccinylase-like protein